jgi:hypothetical protein
MLVVLLGIFVGVLLVIIGLMSEKNTEYKDLKVRLYLLDREAGLYEYLFKNIENKTLTKDRTLKGDILSSLQKQHLVDKLGSDISSGERLYKKQN